MTEPSDADYLAILQESQTQTTDRLRTENAHDTREAEPADPTPDDVDDDDYLTDEDADLVEDVD